MSAPDCSCEIVHVRRPSSTCSVHGRDCYECGKPVGDGEGVQHGRAGWVHDSCNEEPPITPAASTSERERDGD